MQNILRVPLALGLFFIGAALLIPHPAHAATITVVMSDNRFTPNSITVNPGDTVTWVNQGSMAHTATADSGIFDSGTIQPGQQFSVTFNQAGVYGYHCKFHGSAGSGMAGTVNVSNTPPLGASGTFVNPNANFFTGTTAQAGSNLTTANSSQVAQLTAQVQSLLAQIQALQAGGGGTLSPAGSVNAASCPQIGRTLKLGASGSDVSRLQQFLSRDPSVYPEGSVSGYYGALTEAAVKRWQTKYNVVSSGDGATTGYGVVGPRTAAAISLLCSSGSTGGTGTSVAPVGTGTGTVGGIIQVSPLGGPSPLTVSVVATVNTGGSCGGATYTLDFGDGTAQQLIPVALGNCSQVSQTYPHQYVVDGIYQIKLSSGPHTTSATVTVGAGAGGVATTPTGTISVFTTSGFAPLGVTFYVSCAAGSAYNVVFGDGTDLGSSAVSGTKCGAGGLDAIAHTFTRAGTFHVQLVIFGQQSNGTVVPTVAATKDITVTSVSDNYTYNPPQLSPGSSNLQFSVQFDLPTACTGFDIAWGDGSADTIQTDGGSGCSQTTTIATKFHTYPATGSYKITLRRGANLSDVRTIGVTVQ